MHPIVPTPTTHIFHLYLFAVSPRNYVEQCHIMPQKEETQCHKRHYKRIVPI